jgi:hypothetical protein
MADPTATLNPATSKLPLGGGFLLADVGAERIFTPDDFSQDQREFYRSARKFALERVLPAADAIEAKDFPVVRKLVREAGELGFLSLDIPEEYGGLAQDLTTSALVAEAMTVLGSWSVIFGAQVGIGTLPSSTSAPQSSRPATCRSSAPASGSPPTPSPSPRRPPTPWRRRPGPSSRRTGSTGS